MRGGPVAAGSDGGWQRGARGPSILYALTSVERVHVADHLAGVGAARQVARRVDPSRLR
jgi:hypothetical protein